MGIFQKGGVCITNSLKESSVVIINTCGFIKPALKETEEEIKRILQKDGKRVYVYGCAVNRARERLSDRFPDVEGFYSLNEKEQLIKTVLKKDIKSKARLLSTNGYAYLKIADGCSNHCSYCTIPKIKGEYKSVKFEDLINQAEALAQLGIKEIILIAQDSVRYGLDIYNKKMIVPLIKEISRIKGIEWIRLLYAHPKSINDDLISEIKDNPKVCKYLDMPIQHINDRLLKLMNRGITKKEITNLIKKLKGITLRTTVIIGFPTETKEEFDELYNFLKKGYFYWFGAFKYYREKGTTAANLEPLSPKTIDWRFKKIIKLQQDLIKKENKSKLNKFFNVLIHNKNRYFIGHTEFSAPDIDSQIIISRNDIKIGNIYRLKITGLKGTDLYAC